MADNDLSANGAGNARSNAVATREMEAGATAAKAPAGTVASSSEYVPSELLRFWLMIRCDHQYLT